MAQKFYVDLDLTNHIIKNLAEGVADTDAVNVSQLEAAVAGVSGGVATDLAGYVKKATGITYGEGLSGSATIGDGFNVNVELGTGLEVATKGDDVGKIVIDPDWLADQAALSIEGGDGIAIAHVTGTTKDTVSVDLAGAQGEVANAAEFVGGKLYVADLEDRLATVEGDVEAATHPAVTGKTENAVEVDETGQIVSLVIDGTSTAGVLSQSTAGLKADLGNYYNKTEVDGAVGGVTTALGDYVTKTTYNTGQAAQDDALADEATARAAADSALQGKIDTEEAARIAGDNALQTAINGKADQTALEAEVTRAKDAETALQGKIDDEAAARIAADGVLQTNINLKADKVTKVTAGTGLTGGGTLGEDTSFAVDATWLGGQITAGARDAVKVVGTPDKVSVDELPTGTFTVDIDSKYTADRDNYADGKVSAAKLALDTRIDELSIIGDGYVTATRGTGDDKDKWSLKIERVNLADTYNGTGVDQATISADLADKQIVPQNGDLYINENGQAFIYGNLKWTALASAEAGIYSIASADNSIVVTNPAGPATDLGLSAALKTEISTATSTNATQDAAITAIQGVNTAQDGKISALEAASHAAATSGSDAIDVTGQAISLKTGSPELSQDASGLKVNLAAYAKTTDIQTVIDNSHILATGAGAIEVNGAGQVVSLKLASGVLSQDAAGLAIDLKDYSTSTQVDDKITAASHPKAFGKDAIGVASDTQEVSLILDKLDGTQGVLSQGEGGLQIDLGKYALTTDLEEAVGGIDGGLVGTGDVETAGISVTVGGNLTITGTSAAFTHNLNTEDVIVAVRDLNEGDSYGCIVGAAVCVPDKNRVVIEATPGTYRVVVTGGRVAFPV